MSICNFSGLNHLRRDSNIRVDGNKTRVEGIAAIVCNIPIHEIESGLLYICGKTVSGFRVVILLDDDETIP